MPDLASITGAIAALRTATDVARVLRDLDSTVQTADLKLKVAELTDALASAKLAVVEVQQTLAEKDREIERLSDALRIKDEVVRHQDAYYAKNAEQKATGDPYCSFCFEMRHTLVHINQNPRDRSQSVCPNCKNVFHWQRRQNPDAAKADA